MLGHEDGVVGHADVAEDELDGVAGYAAPVALEVAVEALLGDAEDAAGEVEEDLPDAPAAGALVAVVGEDLRGVLCQGDDDLDVADGVDDVEGAPVDGRVHRAGVAAAGGGEGDDEVGAGHAEAAAGADAEHGQAGAGAGDGGAGVEAPQAAAEDEVLRRGDEAEGEAVQGEDEVVEGDGGRQAAVAGGVLGPDEGGAVEGRILAKVRGEAFGDRPRLAEWFTDQVIVFRHDCVAVVVLSHGGRGRRG